MAWGREYPALEPPGRSFHSLAYDLGRNRIVMFGGWGSVGLLGDTWELPSNRPPSVLASVSPASAYTGQLVTLTAAFNDPDGDTPTWRWFQTFGPHAELAGANTAVASLVVPAPGAYGFQVVADDGHGGHGYALGSLEAPNRCPSVTLAPRYVSTLSGAVTVGLTAAASDPDGEGLTYGWSSSPPLALVGPGSARPSVTLTSSDASFVVSLTVRDGQGCPATAHTTLAADALRPTATLSYRTPVTAGGRAVFTVPVTAVIDVTFSEAARFGAELPRLVFDTLVNSGTGSLPPGHLARVGERAFRYSQTLGGADAATYEIVGLDAADLAGNALAAMPANRQFIVNRPPVVLAPASLAGRVGSPVRLEPARASDPDGAGAAFSWSFESMPSSPASSLTTADILLASGFTGQDNPGDARFTPDVAGTYRLRLSADDGRGGTAWAPTVVTAVARSQNVAPTANPGIDRLVLTGTTVELDGTGSFDTGHSDAVSEARVVAYDWTLARPAGSSAVLELASTPRPRFTADVVGSFVLTLAVIDNEAGRSPDATVTVRARVDEPDTLAGVTGPQTLDGRSFEASLDTSADVDVFAFDVRLGFTYTVTLRTTAGPSLAAALLRDAAHVLGQTTVAPSSAGGFRDVRVEETGRIFLQVSSPGGGSQGAYSVTVLESRDAAPFVPRLALELADVGQSVEGVLATSGSSVPLSFVSALVSYDGRFLRASQVTPLATDSRFTLGQVQQLAPPDLSVQFQGPAAGRARLTAGALARLVFQRLSPFGAPDAGLAGLAEVQANASTAVVVRRPVADAGISRQARAQAGVTRLELDGRQSTDGGRQTLGGPRELSPLTFRWTQVGVSPAPVMLDDPTAATPGFVPPMAGLYRFRLVVDNGVLQSAPATVDLMVRLQGLEPEAAPVAREVATGAEASGLTSALTVVVPARLELDGTRSVGSVATSSAQLAYSWRQVAGPASVALSSPTSARVSGTLEVAGLYEFELVTSRAGGLASEPGRVTVLACAPARARPVLSLSAALPGGTAVGMDLGDVPELSGTRGTRLSASPASPTTVTLSARLTDPSPPAPEHRFQFLWRQAAGPLASLAVAERGVTGQTVSAAIATLARPGVHEFACRARQVNAAGALTGAEVERRLRLVADSEEARVPTGVVAAVPAIAGPSSPSKAPTGARLHSNQPGLSAAGSVTLDGRGSTAGAGVRYTWRQVAGPRVELSEPTSPVTTFVAPELGQPHLYAFQLFVDDGLRGEPVAVALTVLPAASAPRTVAVTLESGLDYLALPVDPWGAGDVYRLSDLLRDTGSPFVAWLPSVETGRARRFQVRMAPGTGPGDEPVEGNQGYIVLNPRARRTFTLVGTPWPAAAERRQLAVGLNLVAYPRGTPPEATAATLATTAHADFVVRSRPATGGKTRPEAYLPQLSSSPFPLEAGHAYLLLVPEARTVGLGR